MTHETGTVLQWQEEYNSYARNQLRITLLLLSARAFLDIWEKPCGLFNSIVNTRIRTLHALR